MSAFSRVQRLRLRMAADPAVPAETANHTIDEILAFVDATGRLPDMGAKGDLAELALAFRFHQFDRAFPEPVEPEPEDEGGFRP